MARKSPVWSVAVLATMVLALASPVSALEWRGRELLVTVSSNAVIKAWAVDAAMTAWSESDAVDLAYGSRPKGGKPFITIIERDDGPTGMARTILSNSNGYITAATILLNTYYETTDGIWAYTACHELGHALGLVHDSLEGDDHRGCMNVVYQGRPLPSLFDLERLTEMYD